MKPITNTNWDFEVIKLIHDSGGTANGSILIEFRDLAKSLLREQREEESIKVKVALETFCWERGLDKDPIVDVMKNRKKLNEYVLSILKGNKK